MVASNHGDKYRAKQLVILLLLQDRKLGGTCHPFQQGIVMPWRMMLQTESWGTMRSQFRWKQPAQDHET